MDMAEVSVVHTPADTHRDDDTALARAADDGWPAVRRVVHVDVDATPAERARRAIALLRGMHDDGLAEVSKYDTILSARDNSMSSEAQIRELIGMLQGMTAFAEFLLAQLERATGSDGQAFLASVAEQTERFFPG